jgi:hypothetical protein
MNCDAMASAFQPPSPYTLEAHFDAVTGGRYTAARMAQVGLPYQLGINGALTAIAARPSYQERAALLQVLQLRLKDLGTLRGLVSERAKTPSDDGVPLIVRILVEDALGLPIGDARLPAKAGSPTLSTVPDMVAANVAQMVDRRLTTSLADKVQEIGKDQLGKVLMDLLVEKAGKDFAEGMAGQMKFWKMVREAILAESAEDSLRAVTGYLGPKGAAWVAKHIHRVPGVKLVRSLRFVKRATRLGRLVSLRLAFTVRLVNSLKWLGPMLTTLDLLITSEDAGMSDADTWRVDFLETVALVTNQQLDLSSAFYERCGPKLPVVSLQPLATNPALHPRLEPAPRVRFR